MNTFPSILRASLLAAIALASAGASGRPGDQEAYLIEARILKVPSSPPWRLLTVNSDRITVISPEPAVQLGKAARVDFGGLTMSLDDDVITWNGDTDPPDESGIEVLAAPQLAVWNGQEAELRISSGALEYFERQEDGRFALRRTPEDQQPGLTLAATVHADKAAGAVTLDCRLRIVRCTKRLPLPGVSLDVGPPVIEQQETRTSVVLNPGDWCLLSGLASGAPPKVGASDGGDAHGLLVLVRVTRVPPSAGSPSSPVRTGSR